MINTDNTACAKKINTQFQRLRQHHSKMDKHLNSLNYAVISENEINDWLCGVDHKSPVLLLNTSIYNWENPNWQFVNRGLQREVDYNLLTANQGYFEYIKNTFANQWDFIKKFDKSISLYINDNEKAISIYNKLHTPPEKFAKDEFSTAIEIDLISIFECAETLYFKYDKEYTRYFKENEFSRRHKTNPNCIKLGYGDNNSIAIEMMYRSFTDLSFIKCSHEEFAAHFDEYAWPVPKPIIWSGSNAQLLVLLLGKEFKDDKDNLPKGIYQLKLNQELTPKHVLEHFKLGDITTARTLAANYANIYKRKTIINSKPMKLLIHDLNILATR